MAYFFDALFPGGIQDSGSKVCSSSFLAGSFFPGAHCPGWNIVPVLVGSALFSKLSNNVVDACRFNRVLDMICFTYKYGQNQYLAKTVQFFSLPIFPNGSHQLE